MSEQKWEEEAKECFNKLDDTCNQGSYFYYVEGYLQACHKRQVEIEKEINEAIAFLAAPEMKWDQAMRILFKIVGREYPF